MFIALGLYKVLLSCPSIHLSIPSFIPKIFIEGKYSIMGLPWWLRGRESAYNVEDLGLIPGLERYPGGGGWQPTVIFSLGESPLSEEPGGLQAVGGCKESHMTKQLSTNSIVHKSINSRLPRFGSFFKNLV